MEYQISSFSNKSLKKHMRKGSHDLNNALKLGQIDGVLNQSDKEASIEVEITEGETREQAETKNGEKLLSGCTRLDGITKALERGRPTIIS